MCDRRTDGRTDRQTDGIAVATTALAMRALRRAVTISKDRKVMVSRDPRTKVHKILLNTCTTIIFDWPYPNTAKFRRALTKSVRDIRCGKIFAPRKSRPKFTLGLQICH